MIRKEAVLLPKIDPVVERRLHELRGKIMTAGDRVKNAAQQDSAHAARAASLAREQTAHEVHARMQMEDNMHRPSDRTYQLREYHWASVRVRRCEVKRT